MTTGKVPRCLVFLLISRLPLREGRKFWKSLETDPKLAQLVEEDFRDATPMMGDRIRLGKLWIYSRHGAHLLGYDDISQVYQHVNRYLFFEMARWLECRTVTVQSSRFKSKKTLNLCGLKLRGKSDAELLELFRLLESKNPNIKFGYQ